MKKVNYWIYITILILLIVGLIVFVIWFLQKENIFDDGDSTLLIGEDTSDYISQSWKHDYIYWLGESNGQKQLMRMKGDGTDIQAAIDNNLAWEGNNLPVIDAESYTAAYVCLDNNQQICVYQVKDKTTKKLDLKKPVKNISWSNDGAQLLMIIENDDGHDNIIAAINRDGSNYQEIISGSSLAGSPSNPMLSSSGSEILFQANKENGDTGIYLINTDGSNLHALIDTENMEYAAAFSPDGKQIIYTNKENDTENIRMINRDGSNIKNLTDQGNNSQPRFSPDGNRVIFISDRDDNINGEIYSMNSDGTDVIRLTDNEIKELALVWSRIKITLALSEKKLSAAEQIGKFIEAKINSTQSEILNFIYPESQDNMDLSLPYSNLYADQVIGYEIKNETTLEGGGIDFAIDLKFSDENKPNLLLNYQIEQFDGQWLVTGVSITDEPDTDENDLNTGKITEGSVDNDLATLQNRQAAVDDGNETWLLDPYEVAKRDGSEYGFDNSQDVFTLVSKIDMGEYSGTGEATIEVQHDDEIYIIQLIQPIKQGSEGIWALNSIVKK